MRKGLSKPELSKLAGLNRYSIKNFLVHPMAEILNQTQNSSFNGAVIYPELQMYLHNYKKAVKDQFYFHTLKEKMISYNIAVAIPDSYNYLHSTFKLKINQLIQGGFFDHWMELYMTDPSLIEKEVEDDKIVLTIDHLSVGFTLWLGMLLIASTTFTIELVRFSLHKLFLRIQTR